MEQITSANFSAVVERSDRPVLLEFSAPWCGYCRRLEPLLRRLEEGAGQSLVFAQVNTDLSPELAEAYRLFLARQEDCPCTLCSGDFLPCNGILRNGRVYMIDWAFGGVLPYALDVARLIAYGSEKPEPNAFPFYMDGDLLSVFVRAHYERLERKPDWEQYIRDIKLAALNEYVEFLEVLINDPETTREEIEADFYYRRAAETAKAII